jgi:hypothetical protein
MQIARFSVLSVNRKMRCDALAVSCATWTYRNRLFRPKPRPSERRRDKAQGMGGEVVSGAHTKCVTATPPSALGFPIPILPVVPEENDEKQQTK